MDLLETWRWVNMFLGALGTGVCLAWYVKGHAAMKLQARIGFAALTLWCVASGYGAFEAQYMPDYFFRVPVATAALLLSVAAATVPRWLERRDGVRRF